MKNQDDMKDMAVNIAMMFSEEDFSPEEGMVVLANTLAICMNNYGCSRHEAIDKFTTVVKDIYDQLEGK